MDAKFKKIGLIAGIAFGTMFLAQFLAGTTIPVVSTLAQKATGRGAPKA